MIASESGSTMITSCCAADRQASSTQLHYTDGTAYTHNVTAQRKQGKL